MGSPELRSAGIGMTSLPLSDVEVDELVLLLDQALGDLSFELVDSENPESRVLE
jgi:hypothetical protein